MNSFKLKELLSIKNGKDHKNLDDGNIPVFGSGGLMRYVNKFIYDDESILLPRKGSLDNIQYVNKPFWTVDTLYYSIVNKEKADAFYLYNYLRELDLSILNSGTGVPSMTFGAYYDIEIKLPSLQTQKQIAKVLSDLDAKIELNNKINQELEAMAKTLYDYWFVQFDFPANLQDSTLSGAEGYKSSGGKMVYNEELKREIPEGWEVGTLLDIATYTNGLACQKYRPTTDEYLPVIKIREMRDGFTENTEKVKIDIPKKLVVKNGDILFSWSASLEVMIWSGGTGGLNQHIFKVTSKKYPKSFYYFQLIWYLQHFKMIADLRKTTMGHITQDHLKQSRIVIPPLDVINKIDKQLKPIQAKQVLLKQQNQELTALRDWLLPMLMNGQVTVRQAHGSAVGEAEEKLNSSIEPSRNMAAEPQAEYKKG